jgi:hypothetical protein
MSEQQFTLIYSPSPGDNVVKDVVVTAAMVDPGPNEIWIGFGATVPTGRTAEIDNAFRFLISGIRDRNIIDVGNFASFVSAVDINRITAAGRRTSGDLLTAVVGPNDVVIAMGANVAVPAAGYKVFHEVHFENLRRAVAQFLQNGGVGGGGGGGGIQSTYKLTVTQPAGSSESPALITLNGTMPVANTTATITYDTDTTNPHMVGVPVEMDMTLDELGEALCQALLVEGVDCEYQNGVLYIQPRPPAEAVAVVAATIE